MKSKLLLLFGAALCCLLTVVNPASAQNTVVTYQGRVQSGGNNFTGNGQFKFALVTSTNISAQATATANNSGGFVTIYTVTFGGSGYVTAPAVTVSGGGGSGATATALISGGVVTSIIANNPGSGYTGTPTVTIAAPPENFSYTTYWSNDGTSVAGSEPAAAVNVAVSGGLFTARLGDTTLPNMTTLGAGLFTQPNLQLRLWFNDAVNGFAVLHPAQPLTATPYAFVAGSASNLLGSVSAGQLSGTYGNAVVFNNSANQFAGSYTGNGASVTNVNAAMLGGLSVADFWRTSGNAGTTAGTHFLGTTDNLPVELKVKGTRALRLEPTTDSESRNRVNVIGGSVANFASSGVVGATIAGGGGIPTGGAGNTQTTNVVTDSFGTVGGGLGNQAGNNNAFSDDASNATVAGGIGNTSSGSYSTVGGGYFNTGSGLGATVPGGYQNSAGGSYSFAAGRRAKATNDGTFVWADSSSFADFGSTGNNQFLIRAAGGVGIGTATPGQLLQVGDPNLASGSQGMVRFGSHSATQPYSRYWDIGVPRGDEDISGKNYSFVIDDPQLGTAPEFLIRWDTGFVGIGTTSPGWPFDVLASQAVGRFTSANAPNGSVIELDNSSSAISYYGAINFQSGSGQIGYLTNNIMIFSTAGSERLRIDGNGNVGIGRFPTGNKLEVEGNASKTTAGSWLANSDARIKQDIQPVGHALETLDKVRPVSFRYTEDYRAAHSSVEDRRYLNVVAQDFREVFPEHVKGSGERLPNGEEILQVDTYPLTIYSVAAIQELSRKVAARSSELEAWSRKLESENAELRQRLEKLEQLMNYKNGGAK